MQTEVMGLVLAILLVADGTVLIVTSRNPTKNALTKISYRLVTITPRVGSMTDQTWVLINGLALLIAGALLLARFAFRLIWP